MPPTLVDDAGAVEGRRAPRAWAAVAAVWLVAVVASLVVAAETRIGPVLFTFSRRHGIHLGDVVSGALILTVAAVVSHVLLQRRD